MNEHRKTTQPSKTNKKILNYWYYTTTLYSQPYIQKYSLFLQDTYDINVNVLLISLWGVGVKERVIKKHELKDALDYIQSWDKNVVKKLRDIRRYTKNDTNYHIRNLREKIKKLELNSEYIEQEKLSTWVNGLADVERENIENIDIWKKTIYNLLELSILKTNTQNNKLNDIACHIAKEAKKLYFNNKPQIK